MSWSAVTNFLAGWKMFFIKSLPYTGTALLQLILASEEYLRNAPFNPVVHVYLIPLTLAVGDFLRAYIKTNMNPPATNN